MAAESGVVALVPLRGGSKSIPSKNVKPLCGKPLCAWTLTAAAEAVLIDAVFVSTDSPEIKETVEALNLGVRVIDRPAELATDDASTESVMLHFLERVPEVETLVTIQATSPLLEAHHLDEALAHYRAGGFDSVLSAVRVKRFFWDDAGRPLNYDPAHRPRRQDFAGTLMENGAFYVTRRAVLEQTSCRLGGRIGLYEMPGETVAEIDEPEDWDEVERLLKARLKGSRPD